MADKLKYKRILLKLSGEVLAGDKKTGIDHKYLENLCKEVLEVQKLGVDIGIVVGGGNFWRYRDFQDSGIDRIMSDNMGMMATVMNGSAMKATFEKLGAPCRVMSALHVRQVAEDYFPHQARRHLEKGRIVICVGGTGNPFFTTDSAAASRSLELECDVLLKATKVDGVYSADPEKDKNAEFYSEITYKDVLAQNLKVMDLTAIALCRDNQMPILVFNLFDKGNIKKAVLGEKVGTTVISS